MHYNGAFTAGYGFTDIARHSPLAFPLRFSRNLAQINFHQFHKVTLTCPGKEHFFTCHRPIPSNLVWFLLSNW